MQADKETFYLIHKYLKDQLSEVEKLAFEEKLSKNATLQQEVNLHRLLNEAIVENHLSGIKSVTREVMARKATQQVRTQVGIGLAVSLICGTALLFSLKEVPLSPTEQNHPTTLNEAIVPATPNKVAISDTATANIVTQPNEYHRTPAPDSISQLNQTTISILRDSLPPISAHEAVTVTPLLPAAVKKEVAAPSVSLQQKMVSAQQTSDKPATPAPLPESQPVKKVAGPQNIDLILNAVRGEQVGLPLEDGFNGQFTVFDQNGQVIFQQNIANGYPSSWDGSSQSGSQVGSGQYGFVLKTTSEELIQYGFITVIR